MFKKPKRNLREKRNSDSESDDEGAAGGRSKGKNGSKENGSACAGLSGGVVPDGDFVRASTLPAVIPTVGQAMNLPKKKKTGGSILKGVKDANTISTVSSANSLHNYEDDGM